MSTGGSRSFHVCVKSATSVSMLALGGTRTHLLAFLRVAGKRSEPKSAFGCAACRAASGGERLRASTSAPARGISLLAVVLVASWRCESSVVATCSSVVLISAALSCCASSRLRAKRGWRAGDGLSGERSVRFGPSSSSSLSGILCAWMLHVARGGVLSADSVAPSVGPRRRNFQSMRQVYA